MNTQKDAWKRARDIYFMREIQHCTLQEIADKYGITVGRVSQIVTAEIDRMMKSRFDEDVGLLDRMKLGWRHLEKDVSFHNPGSLNSAFNSLARYAKYFKDGSYLEYLSKPKHFLEWFLALTEEELEHIRGIGAGKAQYIYKIQYDIQADDNVYDTLLKDCIKVF